MPIIDFLLNIAGLLLWLSWRSARFDPLVRTTPATLVGTLRPASPPRWRNWEIPAALLGLLIIRAVGYGWLGFEASWNPKLDLGVITLAFPNDLRHHFYAILAFSFLSFLRTLCAFYFWLLVLGMVNRGATEVDPLLRLVRLHLGPVARWPWPVQLLLPLLVPGVLWVGLHPVLAWWGITSHVRTTLHLAGQGLLVGSSVALELTVTLKYVLPLFLLLYLVTSYVYLGSSPLWEFIATTSRNLLVPIRWLPLRVAKLDFTPLVGTAAILFLLHVLPIYLLPRILRPDCLSSLWPQ